MPLGIPPLSVANFEQAIRAQQTENKRRWDEIPPGFRLNLEETMKEREGRHAGGFGNAALFPWAGAFVYDDPSFTDQPKPLEFR